MEGNILELGCGGGQSAAALAARGHRVTGIELTPTLAAHARHLAEILEDEGDTTGALKIINADFYTADVAGPFDAVVYWDGFGIGSDEDQRLLLGRIAAWLADAGGAALIDIYQPTYWQRMDGRAMQFGDVCRRYAWDASGRMLDTWWPGDREDEAVTQSLACYTPDALRWLIKPTGLQLDAIDHGGGFDADGNWCDVMPELDDAMTWRATLRCV